MNFEKYIEKGWDGCKNKFINSIDISTIIGEHWVIARKLNGRLDGHYKYGIIIGKIKEDTTVTIWFNILTEDFISVLFNIVVDYNVKDIKTLIDYIQTHYNKKTYNIKVCNINSDLNKTINIIFEGGCNEL